MSTLFKSFRSGNLLVKVLLPAAGSLTLLVGCIGYAQPQQTYYPPPPPEG